jgi:hypothetical protein
MEKQKCLFKIWLFVVSTMFFIGCSNDNKSNDSTSINWLAKEITITTEEQLREFTIQVNGGKNFLSQTIKLGQSINLIDSKWIPIGDLSINPFRGDFDGQGFVIGNVGESNIVEGISGLFGYLYGATIKNLGVVVDIGISDFSTVAIAGLAIVNVGTISNCYVTGNIKVSATQESFIGGAMVAVNNGRVENSYAKTSITPNSVVGEFVGENYEIIENCYALKYPAQESSDCVFAIYNDGAISENSGLKSAEAMRDKNTYVNWDFNNIWAIEPNKNDGFPYLRTLQTQ